jgi:hypothetical protein
MRDISEIYITDENQKWINVLSTCDPAQFRTFLKKEKETLPSKYRNLYKSSNERITEFMYTLILHVPGLTHLKTQARNYFRRNNFGHPFENKTCGECVWFYKAPLIDENPELVKKGLSCKDLGAMASDVFCEGFLNREGERE